MATWRSWPACAGAILYLAAVVPQRCSAEGWDVAVALYQDQFCMESLDDMLLVDGACYSTGKWTNSSIAFKVTIVGFGNRGAEWVADYQEFSDDCFTPVSLATSLPMGSCTTFFGRYRAELRAKLRSTNCAGDACSQLAVAEQNYFTEKDCRGTPLVSYRKVVPLQGECMLMRNGSSQTFMLTSDLKSNKIVRVDHPGSTRCQAEQMIEYNLEGGCYELLDEIDGPKSFSWKVQRQTDAVSSNAAGSLALFGMTLGRVWALITIIGIAATGSGA